ncbi:MAG: hypothetical protein RQ743_02695 [Bacteroidales bacterium]|nr:hypothetical protein [Bacteroidales bacterium]
MKNKIYAICFILVLLAPCTVTYLWLLHNKEAVRSQVEKSILKGIDKDRLVVLGFTREEIETELRWEHSREFEYKRQMYDIVETKILGDSIYYSCWWDIEETLINNKISALGKYTIDNDMQKNERKEHINPWFRLIFTGEVYKFHCNDLPDRTIKFITYTNLYNSLIISPPEPPPRYC